MANGRSPLEVLQVAQPCRESWNGMSGDDKARFCGHCQKHVHNLSAMTMDEAERLVCQAGGSLCVRFNQAADGRVITLDYQQRPERNKWLWPITIAAAIFVAIAGAVHGVKTKPRSTIIVGNMNPLRPIATPAHPGGVTTRPATHPSTQPAEKVNQIN